MASLANASHESLWEYSPQRRELLDSERKRGQYETAWDETEARHVRDLLGRGGRGFSSSRSYAKTYVDNCDIDYDIDCEEVKTDATLISVVISVVCFVVLFCGIICVIGKKYLEYKDKKIEDE